VTTWDKGPADNAGRGREDALIASGKEPAGNLGQGDPLTAGDKRLN
jgi:hypothetical protein